MFQLVHVSGQVAEIFDLARDRVFKLPGLPFKPVPNIQQHGIGLFLHFPFPFSCAELVVPIGHDLTRIQCHDFAPYLHDEFRESGRVARADFDGHVRESRVRLERRDILVHRFGWSGESAIDPLGCDQDPALQPKGKAKRALFGGEPGGIRNRDVFVK